MTVDYEQLKSLVKEAMFTGGGINEPSAPEGVPHRMPAANSDTPAQDKGDAKANKMYDIALAAREATEELVEALDEPIFDGAYEHAFKASASLRRALNSLISSGAHPMPIQRVAAPPPDQQKYNAGAGMAAGNYAGGAGGFAMPASIHGSGLEEQADEEMGTQLKGFGSKILSKTSQAKATKERGASIQSGETLAGVDQKERAMLQQVEKILTTIADKDDMTKYRPYFMNFLKPLIKKVEAGLKKQGSTEDASGGVPK